jgi:predicted  nucleic acid-binding Zn-ribbon protein
MNDELQAELAQTQSQLSALKDSQSTELMNLKNELAGAKLRAEEAEKIMGQLTFRAENAEEQLMQARDTMHSALTEKKLIQNESEKEISRLSAEVQMLKDRYDSVLRELSATRVSEQRYREQMRSMKSNLMKSLEDF